MSMQSSPSMPILAIRFSVENKMWKFGVVPNENLQTVDSTIKLARKKQSRNPHIQMIQIRRKGAMWAMDAAMRVNKTKASENEQKKIVIFDNLSSSKHFSSDRNAAVDECHCEHSSYSMCKWQLFSFKIEERRKHKILMEAAMSLPLTIHRSPLTTFLISLAKEDETMYWIHTFFRAPNEPILWRIIKIKNYFPLYVLLEWVPAATICSGENTVSRSTNQFRMRHHLHCLFPHFLFLFFLFRIIFNCVFSLWCIKKNKTDTSYNYCNHFWRSSLLPSFRSINNDFTTFPSLIVSQIHRKGLNCISKWYEYEIKHL